DHDRPLACHRLWLRAGRPEGGRARRAVFEGRGPEQAGRLEGPPHREADRQDLPPAPRAGRTARRMTLNIEIPETLLPLLQPYRYKSIRGGRGSAKSHTVARLLVVLGTARKLNVACCREIQ